MVTPEPDDVTALLALAGEGDRQAFDRLVPLLYDHLRRLARSLLAHDPRATLEPTALVHEAWQRLAKQRSIGARHRGEFLGAAAAAMRRVLVDHARARGARRRAGGERVPLEELPAAETALDGLVAVLEARAGDLVALHEALDLLAQVDPRQARLVELRFFGGLDVAEAAGALGLSLRQAERDWNHARAWLRDRVARLRGA